MIDTCVLDCDGVLADFLGGALKVLNCKYDENFGPKDIISFDLEKTYGITASEMWSVIEEEPEFWLFLQPLPQAKKIVQFCRDHFKNFVIATSPSMDPHCFRQKYEWLRNLGVRHKEIMIGGAKHLLARSDTVLIDDYEKNIAKFEERGGKVCLYPSYQNSNSHLMGNDFDATQFFLENIFGYSDEVFREVPKVFHGGVVGTDCQDITVEEFDAALMEYQKTGKCIHDLCKDSAGWDWDIRECAVCGKGKGLI